MGLLKKIIGTATKAGGTEKGLLSVISEKTGKISFKRSLPIVMTTYALGKAGIEGEITENQLWLCGIAGFIYVGGKCTDAIIVWVKNKYGTDKE